MTKVKKAKNFESYKNLIASIPELELKGATTGYTSLNGNMFTFLSKQGELGIRLGKKDRDTFIEKYHTQLSVQYGSVMKEYVHVPEDLMSDTELLSSYLKLSYDYAKTLKAK